MLHDIHFRRNLQSNPTLRAELRQLATDALSDLGPIASRPARITSLLLIEFIEHLNDDDLCLDWQDIFNSLYTQAQFVSHYEHGPDTRRPEMWQAIERMCYLNYKYSQYHKQ